MTSTTQHDLTAALAHAFDPARVVDLSLVLSENLPCTWPGHMLFQHKTFSWFTERADRAATLVNRSGVAYQTRWMTLDEHTGTHLDAPSHFIPPSDSGLPDAGPAGDISLTEVPVTQSIGPAAVVDVQDLVGRADPGSSPRITADRLRAWEREHGELHGGEVVLLRSRWDRFYRAGPEGDAYARSVLDTAQTPGWPAPDAEAVELLVERGVRCLGTDGTSVGPSDDGGPTHRAGLGHGMVFIEALGHLDRLPPRGAFFVFLPIRIQEGTGGPGRAIAVLPEQPERPEP